MYPQAPPTSGLAIASLVCGILSVFCTCVGLPLGVAALVTGFISRNRIKASGGYQQGNGLALAGIITGGAGIFLNVIVLAFWGIGLLVSAIAGSSPPPR